MDWLRKLLESAKIVDGKLDVDALMKEVNTEFPKNAVPKETFNDINTQLKTANTTIADLKKSNKDNETLQQTIKDHEATIEQQKNDYINLQRENTVKNALKDAGCIDADYFMFKFKDKLEFGEDNNPKNLESIIKTERDNKSTMFTNTVAGNTPPDGASDPKPKDVTDLKSALLQKYDSN